VGNANGEGLEKDDSLVHTSFEVNEYLVKADALRGMDHPGPSAQRPSSMSHSNEQALVSLKIKETVDGEGWCTQAVVIEGG